MFSMPKYHLWRKIPDDIHKKPSIFDLSLPFSRLFSSFSTVKISQSPLLYLGWAKLGLYTPQASSWESFYTCSFVVYKEVALGNFSGLKKNSLIFYWEIIFFFLSLKDAENKIKPGRNRTDGWLFKKKPKDCQLSFGEQRAYDKVRIARITKLC